MLSLKRYLPLQTRMELYKEVLKLREKRLSYLKIIKEIYKRYRIRLYKATISRWINGKMQPFGNVKKFNDKPTPELAYIIGAILGDGSKCYYDAKHQYRLGLAVKDKEFAEFFGKKLAKILGREKPYKPFYSSKNKSWEVVGYSNLLFNFLNKPLKELTTYIEYSRECVTSFLRALFDSEGSIYKRILALYNSNRELLEYIGYLLKKFDIDTSLYFSMKAGKMHKFPSGKICRITKDKYRLYIHADSLMNFYKYIGFTIKRKQRNLEKAIKNQK